MASQWPFLDQPDFYGIGIDSASFGFVVLGQIQPHAGNSTLRWDHIDTWDTKTMVGKGGDLKKLSEGLLILGKNIVDFELQQ